MRETNILYQAPIDYEALVQAVFSDAESYRGHGDLAKHIPAHD
jgi:hypothetical protein